jgi:hypothetical protein
MTSRKIPLEDEKRQGEECFFRVGGKLFYEVHTVDELVDKIDWLQEQLEEKDLMISSLRKKIADRIDTPPEDEKMQVESSTPQLVNIEDDSEDENDTAPISLIGKPIELVKEYLKNQDERMKLSKSFDDGMDTTEWYKLSTPIQNEHDELSSEMIKKGIFESKHDYRSFWKLVGEA